MASLPDPPLGMLSAMVVTRSRASIAKRGRGGRRVAAWRAAGRSAGGCGGFQFSDQAVLGGDHLVGAVALALEVRPVTSRTLFGLGQFGFQFGDPCLECGDRLGDRLATSL